MFGPQPLTRQLPLLIDISSRATYQRWRETTMTSLPQEALDVLPITGWQPETSILTPPTNPAAPAAGAARSPRKCEEASVPPLVQ